MEKQTFPSCWSKDKAARRAERTIFTILYIFGREGWVILVFRFHFDQNSVDVLGSLPADVLWGSFVTHLLKTSFGVRLSRIYWMRDERTPKDLCGEATCWDDAIESDVNFRFIVGDEREPYHFTTSGDLKKSIFFSWNRRLRFEEDLRINISESDGETNTPSLVCNSSAFAAVLKRILW